MTARTCGATKQRSFAVRRCDASVRNEAALETVGTEDYYGIRRRKVEESAGVRRHATLIEYTPARSTRHRPRRGYDA